MVTKCNCLLFFYGRSSPESDKKATAHYYSKSMQSYLWENKTVKGDLLWELSLSVYSFRKRGMTNTR
ncbi:MAG: hypothetical protein Q8M08_07355 [Bacteroidales bacterium]|nr:hypothetical protein [Bacteroidales bacterium]